MTGQKSLFIIGTSCLILMIAAPIVTEAPDAARMDELGQNRPPGLKGRNIMEMIEGIVDWLIDLPVVCQLGICFAVAFILLPFAQWISYKRDVKKYGKEYADEIARRY